MAQISDWMNDGIGFLTIRSVLTKGDHRWAREKENLNHPFAALSEEHEGHEGKNKKRELTADSADKRLLE